MKNRILSFLIWHLLRYDRFVDLKYLRLYWKVLDFLMSLDHVPPLKKKKI
jgi:hypothetical protein